MDKLKAILTGAKDYGLRGFKMFQENKMSVYSGYATLFIVTAVFPCAMLIISVVNLLPGYSTKDVTDILFQILPDLGPIKELIETSISNLKAQSGGLLASAAALTTLWSASKGVTSIQKGLNQLDEEKIKAQAATREDASLKEKAITYAKSTTKQLLFTLTVVILIPALLVFEMLGDSIVGIVDNILIKLNPVGSDVDLPNIGFFFNISALVVVLFALLVIVQIYATLPDIKRTMKSQLPGALITGASWLLFTKLFSFFIPRFYHASSVYGSLASLFLLLLWLRFMVMILFAGGVINHTIEERKDRFNIAQNC